MQAPRKVVVKRGKLCTYEAMIRLLFTHLPHKAMQFNITKKNRITVKQYIVYEQITDY